MGTTRITNFDEFWEFYLSQHAKPQTRIIHALGLMAATSFVTATLISGNPLLLLPAFLSSYGLLWFSHLFIEKNQPATFRYPLWSFLAEWKMVFLLLTGRLKK